MAAKGILPADFRKTSSLWFSAEAHPSGAALSQRATGHRDLPAAPGLRSALPAVGDNKKKNKRIKKELPPAEPPLPAARLNSHGAKRLLSPSRDPLASRVGKPKMGLATLLLPAN